MSAEVSESGNFSSSVLHVDNRHLHTCTGTCKTKHVFLLFYEKNICFIMDFFGAFNRIL